MGILKPISVFKDDGMSTLTFNIAMDSVKIYANYMASHPDTKEFSYLSQRVSEMLSEVTFLLENSATYGNKSNQGEYLKTLKGELAEHLAQFKENIANSAPKQSSSGAEPRPAMVVSTPPIKGPSTQKRSATPASSSSGKPPLATSTRPKTGNTTTLAHHPQKPESPKMTSKPSIPGSDAWIQAFRLVEKNHLLNFHDCLIKKYMDDPGDEDKLSKKERELLIQLKSNHSIKRLGEENAVGNNENFSVTTESGETFIYKSEGRGTNAREAVDKLLAGEETKKRFIHYSTLFETTSLDVDSRPQRNALQIAEWCPLGDVDSYLNGASTDAQTRLNNAVDLFQQMAQALSKFESQGAFFTDMKNKNWLIKNNGGKQELAIADTKSFLQIESDGTVTPGVGLNKGYSCYATERVSSDKLLKSATISVDPYAAEKPVTFTANTEHVYMLGKNIDEILKSKNFPQMNSPQRTVLEALRNDCLLPEHRRISLKEAQQKLERLAGDQITATHGAIRPNTQVTLPQQKQSTSQLYREKINIFREGEKKSSASLIDNDADRNVENERNLSPKGLKS